MTARDEALCRRRKWDGTRLCDKPAVVHLIGMCVHEHICESRFCADHADYARARNLACVQCKRSSEPHYCLVSAVGQEPVA